jgi:hypothetical protein
MAANPFAQFAAPAAANPFAEFTAQPPAAPAPSEIPGPRQPGFFQTLVNRPLEVLEVPLAVGANVVSGLPVYLSGALGPEAQRAVARNIQYQPRGQLAQDVLAGIGKAAEVSKIPPFMPQLAGFSPARVPTATETRVGVKKAVGPSEAKLAQMTAEDYARGPQIDAAAQAQRLGIALNPTDIQPTVGAKLLSAAAGPRAPEALATANKTRVREIQLNELGLPSTAQLNTPQAFQQARKQVAKPYEEVAKLPIQQADDAMVQRLEALRADLDVIGAKEYAPAIGKIVDDAISKTQTGLTGDQLLKNISVLRERARKTYNNKSATTEALDVADTNLKVATELESLIENSITNPKLLDQFRDARQKMARSYAYEGATDLNTGILDVKKLARITSKDNNLTGDIAALGQIAGNFPDVFTSAATPGFFSAPRLSRSGAAGAAGALAGSPFGLTGSIVGGLAGSALGEVGGAAASRMLASPGYQRGLQLRDLRAPVTNQLAAQQLPIPQDRALVPYQAPVEVLMPGEGPYQPNFVMQPNQYSRVVPGTPEAPLNRLAYDPNAPVQGQPGVFDIMRQRERDLSMRQGMAAEQQAAAAEAATRRSAGRGVELVLDANGNLVPAPSAGAGGVVGAPSALESAVAKMSGRVIEQPSTSYKTMTISPKSGAQPYTRVIKREGETTFERGVPQAFNMTAEEKIAWNKAKADLAEVMPGMKTLSDEAIAARMADVKWSEQAVANARAKAEQLARQEALLTEQLANRNNLRMLAREIEAKNKELVKIQADRQRMMDLAEQMEEGLRAGRPVKTGGQGPKTRAFQRNKLNRLSDQDVVNELLNR